MRIVSWNVNGIRAAVGKGFVEKVAEMDPDILCLQETKAQDDQVLEALKDLNGYEIYSNSAERKGYSGTAILSRVPLNSVSSDIGAAEHDTEGRVLTADYDDFHLVNVYVPNSGQGLKRLDYRKKWDDAFRSYLIELQKTKPVILTGDLNVAHKEIDIARPKANYNKTAGYTQTEIDGMDALIDSGFVDTFRRLNPDEVKYSWWSFRGGARAKNIGWRIDYFVVSENLISRVSDAFIWNEMEGSDHCPVGIEL
ncbi:MAG TPA: exodeoxyribonuclease III [Flavobacteriales bacterium]|jgi:exodeoxyribonuclease-3|nr:exodeoxyribonuclease III [Flavobacteriales bacterium]